MISPVGAIVNGLEVLEDDQDESMRVFALELIAKSARAGLGPAEIRPPRLRGGRLGGGLHRPRRRGERRQGHVRRREDQALEWSAPQALFRRTRSSLLLNLVMIATSAIPARPHRRSVTGSGEAPTFVLKAKGSHARIPPHAVDLIAGEPENGTVDAHGILPYYAGLVARAAGMVSVSRSRATKSPSWRIPLFAEESPPVDGEILALNSPEGVNLVSGAGTAETLR